MKFAVMTSDNRGLKSEVAQRFGRAPYLVIVNIGTEESKVQKNQAAAESSGAGIAAAQTVFDENVEAVIAGNFGPKAFDSLKAGQLKLYSVFGVTVEEALAKVKQGELEELSDYTRSAHSGLNQNTN